MNLLLNRILTSILASTLLLSAAPFCGADEAPVKNAAPVITDGLSPSFQAVVSHLELGGCFFNYTEAGGTPFLVTLFDEMLKIAPEAERKDLPAGLSFSGIYSMLGLNGLEAVGSSSRQRADGAFHSRTFSYIPKGRTGLLGLAGGPAEKLLLNDFAPKDTDFAIEFPIHLKGVAAAAMPTVLKMLSPVEQAKLGQQMMEPLPGVGVSAKELLEKLDSRVGLFVRLDPAHKTKFSPDMPELPMADAVLVVERAGWLLRDVLPKMMDEIARDPSVKVIKDGPNLTIMSAQPMGQPPMDFQPVVRIDAKADRIIAASRVNLLESVLAGTDRVTDGEGFKSAWRDLPEAGNTALYVSPRLLQTFSGLIETAAQSEAGKSADTIAGIQRIFGLAKPFLSHPQAVVLANEPDGIFVASNTSIAMGSSPLPMISVVATLAGIALPVFAEAQIKGRLAADINQVKQMTLALNMYAADHSGKYPETLAELVKGKYADESLAEFSDPVSKQRIPWIYNNKVVESSPAGTLLIAVPASRKGSRAAAFKDLSARIVTDDEFAKLSAQGTPAEPKLRKKKSGN